MCRMDFFIVQCRSHTNCNRIEIRSQLDYSWIPIDSIAIVSYNDNKITLELHSNISNDLICIFYNSEEPEIVHKELNSLKPKFLHANAIISFVWEANHRMLIVWNRFYFLFLHTTGKFSARLSIHLISYQRSLSIGLSLINNK